MLQNYPLIDMGLMYPYMICDKRSTSGHKKFSKFANETDTNSLIPGLNEGKVLSPSGNEKGVKESDPKSIEEGKC